MGQVVVGRTVLLGSSGCARHQALGLSRFVPVSVWEHRDESKRLTAHTLTDTSGGKVAGLFGCCCGSEAGNLNGISPGQQQVKRFGVLQVDVGQSLKEVDQVAERIETVLLGRLHNTVD